MDTSILTAAAATKSLQSCPTLWPHIWQPTRLPCPWDSPGKNTGVGCHFLLQCMKVKSESEVTQSCLTLSNPMDCSLPGSSIHGIFQAGVLGWVAILPSWNSHLIYSHSKLSSPKLKWPPLTESSFSHLVSPPSFSCLGWKTLESSWLLSYSIVTAHFLGQPSLTWLLQRPLTGLLLSTCSPSVPPLYHRFYYQCIRSSHASSQSPPVPSHFMCPVRPCTRQMSLE